jgi:hypothetical protein
VWLLAGPGRAAGEYPHQLQIHGRVGDHHLDRLEIDDPFAELQRNRRLCPNT